MSNPRATLARVLDSAELVFSFVALALCWATTAHCLITGRAALEEGGPIPRGLSQALALAADPAAPERIEQWVLAAVYLAAGAAFAVSACHGSWQTLRRLSWRG